MIIENVMEVDDTGMLQATVIREDGSFIVTMFESRDHLLQFVREDAIYGTDPRLTATAGYRPVLQH
jgi:hypothetical protein